MILRADLLRLSIQGAVIGVLLTAAICGASDKPLNRKGLSTLGEIVLVTGKAQVRLVPEETFRPAASRQGLVANDIVKTAAGARLSILFRDQTQLKVGSSTTLIIKETAGPKEKTDSIKILLRLESGEVWTRSKGIRDGLIIETPHATAAIRGTEWGLFVDKNESRVAVLEGHVQLSNPLGSITVGKNEEGVVISGAAPIKSVLVRPADRTQWTFYLTEKRLLRYLMFTKQPQDQAEKLFNAGSLGESGSLFQETLAAAPGDQKALTGLALIALKKGNLSEAEGYLEKVPDETSELPGLLGKAYLLIAENRTEEAARILGLAERSYPGHPLPIIFTAYLHAFHGDYPAALKECDRGLAAFPDHPLLLAFKLEIDLLLNKLEQAADVVERLVRTAPASSEAYEKLGLYHRRVTGNGERAKENFRNAIRLDPSNDEAIASLSDLLREEGYLPEALKWIDRALSLAPWNAAHHYHYGRLLLDMNRMEEARKQFRTSLQLDPNFSNAYLGEGIILLKEGKTEEALTELSKANLFEPELSETHVFLAIAYYQKEEVNAALEELQKAEECDPFNSTPHQLASAVYNDLYLPVESIEEAQKVLKLLPYGRTSGEALLEGAQNGTMSVNFGLGLLDLPEWSLYYAQRALFINPYRNTSHIGVAQAYRELGEVSALQGFNEFKNPYFSEQLQGLTLDVTSLNYSNRNSTLIKKPGHYLTLGGIYGRGDSEEKQLDALATGDFGSPFPLTYWLDLEGFRDSGSLPHSKTKNLNSEITLGYKPGYDHDIYVDLAYYRDRFDVPARASATIDRADLDQKARDDTYWIELGYHKRFSPVSHLLADLRYLRSHDELENPDPGKDASGFDQMRGELNNIAFGIRHMLTVFESHQGSYGIDYNRLNVDSRQRWPYNPPDETAWIHTVSRNTSVNFHLYDRWSPHPRVTLDGGLFLSRYSATDEDQMNDSVQGATRSVSKRSAWSLNPRLGLSWDLGQGVFRAAYQRRATPGFRGELAPVGCAGLVPPTFDIQFNKADDIEASVEVELTKTTFLKGLLGYEKLEDLSTREKAQLGYSRFALNQILGRHFAFSVRYHYNHSKVLDGSGRELIGIPRHSGDARLVFVHPSKIALSLSESYVGKAYADAENTVKLQGYFLTNFTAEKQLFDERIFLSLAVTNLFDKTYDTLDHPYWWHGQGLRAKGRTVSFRAEYRF